MSGSLGDLVVCSLEPWDDVWRRNQHLVAGLLTADPRARVLFVEPPADPAHALRRGRFPRRANRLRPVPDVAGGRLWAYQQTKLGPRRLGPGVDAALTAGVRRAAHALGFTDPVLWINDPARAPLLRRTGWPAVYDITDDWLLAARSPRQHKQVSANEAELVRRCAAVVVCSPRLEQTKGRIRPVELVPNAVDAACYRAPAPRPHDLPDGPVVCYVGTLHEDRLDVDLCVELGNSLADKAVLRGGASLVFVGPNALSPANTARLEAAPAVCLLGARPHADVPAYLRHADVLVVPHVVTGFTDSLDPIKLYEYLASGRPVVSTPVAGFRDAPAPVTVSPADGFASAVRAALAAPDVPAEPPDLPTWDERAEQFRRVLQRIRSAAA